MALIDDLLGYGPENKIHPYEERKRETYAGIPEGKGATMWDYAVEEDGEGNKIISFLVNDSVFNFKLSQPGEDGAIPAQRLPDADKHDFGRRGQATKGRFQVHRSSPSSIYGTIQGGGKTMTFGMDEDPESKQWRMVPKNAPFKDVSELVNAVSPFKKKAAENSLMERISAPLTAPYETAVPLSALLGAGLMGARNLGLKLKKRIMNEEDDTNPLLMDLALGGVGGGALAAGFKYFGEGGENNNDPWHPRFNHYLPKHMPLRFDDSYEISATDGTKPKWWGLIPGKDSSQDRAVKKMTQGIEKKAFAQSMTVSQLQNTLAYDPRVTMADRRILLDQLNKAQASQGQTLDVGRLQRSGLGMLAGYIMAKMMGFGAVGQAFGAGVGAVMGGAKPSGQFGKKYDSRGFYYY